MKKDLIDRINKAAKIINQQQRYGNGNYIIVNNQVADVLNGLNLLEERKQKIQKIINRINKNSN
jgi:hypothetical protein